MYLWFVQGVPYREFYDAIIDDFVCKSEVFAHIYRRVHSVYSELLSDPVMTDEMELEEFAHCPFVVEPSRWIFVNTCMDLDRFYRDLTKFLMRRFPKAKNLRSAVEYQKNLVVTPDYSSRTGKSFSVNRDWPRFFDTVNKLGQFQKLPEPIAFHLPRVAEVAEEDRCGWDNRLNFGEGRRDERSYRWLLQMVSRINASQFSNLPPPNVKKGSFSPFRHVTQPESTVRT
jgi:hypothetical protein